MWVFCEEDVETQVLSMWIFVAGGVAPAGHTFGGLVPREPHRHLLSQPEVGFGTKWYSSWRGDVFTERVVIENLL